MKLLRLYCSLFFAFAISSVCFSQEMKIEWMAGGQYGYPSQSAFSPDGRYILTQSEDSLSYSKIINIWDAQTLLLKNRIPGNNFRFTPGGELLIGTSLWDIDHGKVIAVIDSSELSRYYYPYVTLDGQYWIMSGPTNHLKIKEASTGMVIDSLLGSFETILVSEVENFFFYKLHNTTRYLRYDIGDKSITYDSIFSRDMAEKSLTPLKFLSNSHYVLARTDSLIRVYDISSHSFVYTIYSPSRSRLAPTFSNDNSLFATSSRDTFKIHNALTGEVVHSFALDRTLYSSFGAFSFSKDRMVFGHYTGTPYDAMFRNKYVLWDLYSGKPIKPLTYTNGPTRAFWTRTQEHFVTADYNRRSGIDLKTSNLALWYSPSRRKIADIDSNVYEDFSLSPDDDLIAYSTEKNRVIVRNYFSNQIIAEIDRRNDTNRIAAIVLGPDSLLAIGYWIYDDEQTQNIELYNVYTGKLLRTLHDSYNAYKITFSKDNGYMAALCHHGARVWRTDTWESTLKGDVPAYWRLDINFTGDNKFIVILDREGRHNVHDAVTGRWRRSFFPPPLDLKYYAVVGGSAAMHDGRHIIAGYFDYSYPAPFYSRLYIWDMYTGKRVALLDNLPPSIASVSVNRQGKILTGGHDGTVTVWTPLDFPTDIAYATELLKETPTTAFPNPASSQVTFEFLNNKPDFGQIEIFDTKGILQMVFLKESFSEGKNSFTISTESLSAGIYYSKITSSNKIQFVKFVVL